MKISAYIYIYSNSGFEYRIKKIKSGYNTFWNQTSPKVILKESNT